MFRKALLLFLILLSLTALAEEIGKVHVYKDGTITYNQKEVSLLKLHDELRELKKQNGTVWYYREDGSGEPHPQAANVIQAVIGAGLPISLSSEPDFSTVVLPDGTIEPRKQPAAR